MSSRRTERPPNAGGKEEKPSAAAVNAGSFGLDGSANVVVWRRRDDFGRLGKKRQRVAGSFRSEEARRRRRQLRP